MMATCQNGSQSLVTEEKRNPQTGGGQSTETVPTGERDSKEKKSSTNPVSPAPFQSMEACFSAFDSDG